MTAQELTRYLGEGLATLEAHPLRHEPLYVGGYRRAVLDARAKIAELSRSRAESFQVTEDGSITARGGER